MIPQVDACRFASVSQIAQKVENDDFTYKSVRTVGKVVRTNEKHVVWIADPLEGDMGCELKVNAFLVKGSLIEQGKVYEFLGDVEEDTMSAQQTEDVEMVEESANKENEM